MDNARICKIVVAAGCLWAAAVAAVWPHTSFSGAGGDVSMISIEKLSQDLSPDLAEDCRSLLSSFGHERMRALIAAGYPSFLHFSRNSRVYAELYLDQDCPVGPLLAFTSLVAEGADSVRRLNGSRPLHATP